MLRLPVLLIAAMSLAACATLSREECESGDWNKIGLQDGSDGRLADRFSDHVKACKLDGSDTNRAIYLAAREKGLAEYCTDARGYREGALGQKYLGTCPPALAPAFLKGFQLGKRIHDLDVQISDVADAYRAAGDAATRSRLAAEDARLKEERQKLKAEADALVAAARKKN